MKTTIIIVVLLFSVTIRAQIQKIEYDYTEGKFKTERESKPTKIIIEDDSTIRFVVSNYNPLRYSLEIGSTPSGLLYQQKPSNFKYFDISNEGANIDENSNIPLDTIKVFQYYYNELSRLNSAINDLIKYKTLKESDIKEQLSDKVEKIKYSFAIPNCETLDCADSFTEQSKIFIEEVKDRKIRLQIKMETLEQKQKKNKESVSDTQIAETKVQLERYTNFNKDIDEKYGNDLTTMIANYRKLAFLEYETEQEIEIEDTDKIKLKITGKDNYSGKNINRPIENFIVKKWLKIDFSTGAFWSRLYDEDYIKNIQTTIGENNTTTNTYAINKLDKGRNSFGAMAFINFHTQRNKNLNYGLSLGTGLLFNQSTKIVLAPTASILFGTNQRAIVHLGVALAQVDRIISGYGDGVAFSDGNYNPVTKQYVGAEIMAGLSWNLTK